jgi:integrase
VVKASNGRYGATHAATESGTLACGTLAALFVVAITLGLRPGELRKLTWDLVDLNQGVVHVWRSASKSGDTKTPQSKRSLVLHRRAITALKAHQDMQARDREAAGKIWQGTNLVFCQEDGSMFTADALNWRFGKTTRKAGIGHWHAHEGRHTAVSIMSSNGVPIQDISDTVGHKSTHVTETVYRHVIRPTIRGSATIMDSVFSDPEDEAEN